MYKKKFGQNFLINENISDQIIELESINNRNILEVGVGNLALTKRIINKKPDIFFSLEIDRDIISRIKNEFYKKFIRNFDALKIDELSLFKKKNFSIISNLPFNISSQLLIKWLKIQNNYNCINSMTLMFQKELAERIIAEKDNRKYGRLSILSSAFFNIEKKIDIRKEDFFPIPKVDATVLKFTPLKKNKINKNDFLKLEKITSFFFNERRKKNEKKIKKLFNDTLIKDNRLEKYFSLRPENIDKNEYYKFCKIL
ncbi:16S rRNA (adenine(1518)-N(6)/adenine(1519)-N(6))-dimethyltransferase RsmA [Candidatus Pelagibacter sp. HIMB1517]|uniref:16S rRNA (adenine(1518)-N(6)/adenine(1519)-N(6))- dimethyltransferase RsmA n=1 Tax=Candidatus Pelagibacter sp. HIMB1517 TaxID=3413341 RepID=UPI003F83A1F7